MKQIQLKPLQNIDIPFLYKLLSQRPTKHNISHKKMPTYEDHVKFVKSKPYSKWYIVILANKKIGSVYLTKLNEIGIHLQKEFDYDKIKEVLLQKLMEKNPRNSYLVNVSPNNKKAINFFTKRGFKLIQFTYELNFER